MREGPDFLRTDFRTPFSKISLEWLHHIEETMGEFIAHGGNGPEVRIGSKKVLVDGFDAESGIIYQFHGCFYHAHEICQDGDKPHPYRPGKTMRDVRQDTADMAEYLRGCGYQVVEMWECVWRQSPERQQQQQRESEPVAHDSLGRKPSEQDIINAVQNGTLFGLVYVDIRTPDHLKDRFAELPPIFKNTEVSREDIGDFMKAYAERTETLKKPTRLLISSYHATKILLATPLLKWYLDNGLEVTKVHTVIAYEPKACFGDVVKTISDARRQGDKSKDSAILAESMKLIGNSCYGKCAEDKRKHTTVHYADSRSATHLANSKLFKKMTMMQDDLFEVEEAKKRIVYDLPHHIAFFVYQYAKLKMLQLRYDFLDQYVDPTDFQMVEMDTDSCYMALSQENLEQVIKEPMRRQYYEDYHKWFPSLACDDHRSDFVNTKVTGRDWVQPECCKQRTKFDKRTPGLFKVEWEGEGIVALCSKTYYCFGEKEGDKISCKGIQKKRNNLTKEQYLTVLETQQNGIGVNKGFRALPTGHVYTYIQTRHGLSYLYPKRKVLDDGVSTIPLDL